MGKDTKDTKFMLALYDIAKERGDIYMPINRYEVGKKIALQDRGVNAICKLLVQANFIRKEDEELVYLTEHGFSLIKNLRKLS